jgi:hypothetical protein
MKSFPIYFARNFRLHLPQFIIKQFAYFSYSIGTNETIIQNAVKQDFLISPGGEYPAYCDAELWKHVGVVVDNDKRYTFN